MSNVLRDQHKQKLRAHLEGYVAKLKAEGRWYIKVKWWWARLATCPEYNTAIFDDGTWDDVEDEVWNEWRRAQPFQTHSLQAEDWGEFCWGEWDEDAGKAIMWEGK